MRRRALLAGLAALPTLPVVRQAAHAQGSGPQAPEGPVVFAAASLTDAFKALGTIWVGHGNPMPRFSFAASSTLARQIEQGAPADIFASADEQWMDYVQQRNLIVQGSRTSPLGNDLVLVAPAATAHSVALDRNTDFLKLLGADGKLATGDPAHVPAGIYAEAALKWMGQWDAIQPRLARAADVRSALLLVERGEAPYGIVYGTDAAVAPNVKVVGTFPPESHPPVSYPFALTRHAAGNGQAQALLAFLTGPEAADTYRRFGFGLHTA